MSLQANSPQVTSKVAHTAFEEQAVSMGLDPSDLWVGGYVDYEWQRLNSIFSAYAIKPSGLKVLEFGSNVGASSIVYASLGATVTAVDVCTDFVKLAKLNAQQYEIANIQFHFVPDTRKLPFCDGSFDLINCNSVLEYVDSEHLMVVQCELDRLLRPSGKILVTGTSSRLWPKEVHSRRWLVNYLPRWSDRLLGAPGGLQRGVTPWFVRKGFGVHYVNHDVLDKGEAYLQSRSEISPTKIIYYRWVVRLANMLGVGAGLLTNSFSCLLQKQQS
ncbi:MAG: class I SAM-dependent methyltransferase [Pseudomonadota bacterium]